MPVIELQQEKTLKQHSKRKMLGAALAVGLVTFGRAASAHGEKTHAKKAAAAKKEQKDWGIAGDAKDAKRTIDCRMLDAMRFSPDRVDVKLNETLRFTAATTAGCCMSSSSARSKSTPRTTS